MTTLHSRCPWYLVYVQVFAALGLACTSDGPDSDDDSSHTSSASSSGGSSTSDTIITSTSNTSSTGSTDSSTPDSTNSSAWACSQPQPILRADNQEPTGYIRCEDGFVYRDGPANCAPTTELPNEYVCAGTGIGGGECTSNNDCQAKPGTMCTYLPAGGTCSCVAPCETDNDCAAGSICACAGTARAYSVCVSTACAGPGDCGSGHCGLHAVPDDCSVPHPGFTCVDQASACHSSSDCELACNGQMQADCGPSTAGATNWTCIEPTCVVTCGRPYLQEGQPRFASLVHAGAWQTGRMPFGGDQLAHDEGLARYWTKIALAEHASIASFARTLLQLMAFGAPARLLQETSAALRDEIEHAKLAFGLAAKFGAPTVSPGEFPLGDSTLGCTPEELIDALIVEACIGETLSASEVALAAQRAAPGPVKDVLTTIADDEARHAALGWQSLAWMLQRFPEHREFAKNRFGAHVDGFEFPAGEVSPAREVVETAGGKLSARRRAALYREVLAHVIRPAFDRILVASPERHDVSS